SSRASTPMCSGRRGASATPPPSFDRPIPGLARLNGTLTPAVSCRLTPPGLPHAIADGPVFEHMIQMVGETLGIARIDQNARIAHHLWQRAAPRDDDRDADRHGFERGNTKAFHM